MAPLVWTAFQPVPTILQRVIRVGPIGAYDGLAATTVAIPVPRPPARSLEPRVHRLAEPGPLTSQNLSAPSSPKPKKSRPQDTTAASVEGKTLIATPVSRPPTKSPEPRVDPLAKPDLLAGQNRNVAAPSFPTLKNDPPQATTVSIEEGPVATSVATSSMEPRVDRLAKPGPLTGEDQSAPSSPTPKDSPSPTTTASVTTALAPEQTSHSSRAESERVEPKRDNFDVIDLYTGAHIIIVCSTLTKTQKNQFGCP
jgi:hypothetical protein